MNIEQIVKGAPEGATHYCKRIRKYFRREGNTDTLYVWLSGTEVWSVPVENKTRWLDQMANFRTIIAQAEEIQQLRERLGKIESLWDECGRWPDTSSDIAALDEVIYQAGGETDE